MEPTDNPKHPANRYPWNVAGSRVRGSLDDFLAIAGQRLQARLDPGLAFDRAEGLLVIEWLADLLDRPPHKMDAP